MSVSYLLSCCCHVQKVNFDLTRSYLDLIVTYFCIMIIVSRVEDRRAVLGLFNFAYELQNGKKYACHSAAELSVVVSCV